VRDRLTEVLSSEDRWEIDLGFSSLSDLFLTLGACNFAFLWFLRTVGLASNICSFAITGLDKKKWEKLCLKVSQLEGWQLSAIAYRVERPLCLCEPEEIEAVIPQKSNTLEAYIKTLNEQQADQWAKLVLTLKQKIEEFCRERENEKAGSLPD